MHQEPKPQQSRLPLRRSRLPSSDELLPYLRRIDEAQWYTNFGALVQDFEARLAQHFGVMADEVVTVANGTLGLVAALQAQGATAGKLCIMPSFTFAATPAAALAAGLIPYFVDVSKETWALEVVAVEAVLKELSGAVAAVMPVSPFGAPVDAAGWDDFASRHGVNVIIDGAGAIDSLRPGRVPAMVSLHATKVLGVGEGGLVVARNPELIARIRRCSNFGFAPLHAGSGAKEAGGNYKMSEYTAAVGHASLDAWPQTRKTVMGLAAIYREALDSVPGIRQMQWFGKHGGAYCVVELAEPIGEQVVRQLDLLGVESRLWWGHPCHRHPAYAGYGHSDLSNTEWLVPRVLSLPFYPELSRADVLRVCNALASILSK
jgi:dTDP-4-amino-4,6-dideoxygalactose transaminase